MASYDVVTLLIVAISYAIIILKVKSNPPPQSSGLSSSERKLSVTLFIVTVVSILTILPWVIYVVISLIISLPSVKTDYVYITKTTAVLFYANSMVNPLIYAIRMQEFRKALKELICEKNLQSQEVFNSFGELHVM